MAKAGADVTFIARGAHLQAMREKGLRLEGGRGGMHIAPELGEHNEQARDRLQQGAHRRPQGAQDHLKRSRGN
jgi:ketopantoate reductase